MKKVILIAAIFAGAYTTSTAYASINFNAVNTEISISQEDFKEIKIEELAEPIQKAVKEVAGTASDIAKIEFSATTGNTRLTLVVKADKSEKVVVIDKDGKEVKA